MDDTDKSVIDKLADIVKNAVLPSQDPEEEALAEKTNEQMLLGDAAIAPEAVPAPVASKKRSAAPKKSAKQVARPAAKTPKKLRKSPPKNPRRRQNHQRDERLWERIRPLRRLRRKRRRRSRSVNLRMTCAQVVWVRLASRSVP